MKRASAKWREANPRKAEQWDTTMTLLKQKRRSKYWKKYRKDRELFLKKYDQHHYIDNKDAICILQK